MQRRIFRKRLNHFWSFDNITHRRIVIHDRAKDMPIVLEVYRNQFHLDFYAVNTGLVTVSMVFVAINPPLFQIAPKQGGGLWREKSKIFIFPKPSFLSFLAKLEKKSKIFSKKSKIFSEIIFTKIIFVKCFPNSFGYFDVGFPQKISYFFSAPAAG